MNRTTLVCGQCGDRCSVPGDALARVRHWCWRDDAGLWCSMGWTVDE